MYLSSLLRLRSRIQRPAISAVTIMAVIVALLTSGVSLHAQGTGDLFIRLGTVTASSGTVVGNTVYLLEDSSELRFPIIYGNRTGQPYNISNGFVIYGDDDGVPAVGVAPQRGTGSAFWGFSTANGGNYKFGSPSGPLSGLWIDTTGYYPKSDFGILYKFIGFGCNGTAADTVIFAGASGDPAQLGLRPNDSGEFFSIRILAKLADTGKWICIDSTTNFPPTNKWKWAPFNCQSGPCENGFPSWSGPQCFVIQNYQEYPDRIANCVPELKGTPNQLVSYDFNVSGGSQAGVWWQVDSGVGTIDSLTGEYAVDSLAPGRYPVIVSASDPNGERPTVSCRFEVVIGQVGIENCVYKLAWLACEESTYDFNLSGADQLGVRWKVISGGGAIDSLTGVYWAKDLMPMPEPGTYHIVIAAFYPSTPEFKATCSFELELRACGILTCPTKVIGSYCGTITYDFNTKGQPSSRFRFEMIEGPGSIDSVTGLYSATGVLPGKYLVKVAAIDTYPPGATYQCWFDLFVSQCGITNCPINLDGVSCRPIAYDFNGDGADQSIYRWSITSGPGSIDSLTGVYLTVDLPQGSYPVEVTMTKIGDSASSSLCSFNLNILDCGIANCLTTINWNTCQKLTRDFAMVGEDQGGYRWFMVSGVGTIDSVSGDYELSSAEVGTYPVTFGVRDQLGYMDTAYCSFTIHMTTGGLTVNCPQGVNYVNIGETQYRQVLTTGSCGPVRFFEMASTLHGAMLDTLTGFVRYTGDTADANFVPHCMTVGVTDGHDTTSCSVCWVVNVECQYELAIERKSFAMQGAVVDLDITLRKFSESEGLSGFDLVVAYDNSALSLQSVRSGDIFPECGWEYFTYRQEPNPNCSSGCPSGLVRFAAIADLPLGQVQPTCDSPKYVGNVPVSLANLSFLVSTSREFECTVIPVWFYWLDCGSNTVADASGTKLFMNCHIFEPWLNQQIEDPDAELPGYVGAPRHCLESPPQATYARNVEFYNGYVDVTCVDSVDSRGDINLNGVAYEIADVFMFINYFIIGTSAFGDHVAGSIAASDVNADGVPLSLPDLIYLIRVVIGDAAPFPKTTSDEIATVSTSGGKISVTGVDEIGALYMELKGEVALSTDRSDFIYFSNYDGTRTRVIAVIPFTGLSELKGFSGDLFNADNAEISRIELVDLAGNVIETNLGLPGEYSLRPNYPNPFNPSTTISFDSPKAGAYKITVYNMAGQKVTEISGTAIAGSNSVELNLSGNSSGVYLYRLETEGYTATRKAVLLK